MFSPPPLFAEANHRREQKHELVRACGDYGFRQHELEEVREGLEEANRADHVRAAPQLNRRPDFTVGEKNVGDEQEQRDERQQALPQDERRREPIGSQIC